MAGVYMRDLAKVKLMFTKLGECHVSIFESNGMWRYIRKMFPLNEETHVCR